MERAEAPGVGVAAPAAPARCVPGRPTSPSRVGHAAGSTTFLGPEARTPSLRYSERKLSRASCSQIAGKTPTSTVATAEITIEVKR